MAELLAANQITIAKVLDGEQGIPGEPGADGKTSYFHIKYSAVANPTSSSEISETPLAYIGTYVDFTETDSTDPTKYTWSRFEGIQGEKGEQGIPGVGQDGKTSYLHIAYATSADGSEGFSISESANKTYIGQYTDFTEADSTDYTKYSWTKIKGEMSAEQIAQLNQASEDASTAKDSVDTLSDKTRSGFIETLSGTGFVQSNKTEDGGTSEAVVYGKSEQIVTEQSANLCPTYDKWTLSGGAYIDGDYIVFPSAGAKAQVSVHWKKANNYLWFNISGKSDSDEAVDLYIGCSNGNGWARQLTKDETVLSGKFGGNGDEYGNKLLNSDYVTFTISHYGTTTGSMRIRNFMVSKTYIDTNSNYVPFVPDSPSPEYPSEIQSVENPKVTVTAKNLLGGEALANVIVEKGGTKNLSNKTVQWQCSAVSNKSITESIKFKENTQYSLILYGKCLNNSFSYTNFRIIYTDGSEQNRDVFKTAGEFSYAIVQSKAGKTIKDFSFWLGSQGTILEYEKCGLFEGIVNTEQFEPYKGKTATLSDIVLRSTSDGTRDKLFKDTDGLWKVERKCGVVDLGTLTWTYNSTYAVFEVNVNTYTSFPTPGPNNMGMCSKYLVHGSVVASELANYDDTIFICPYNWSSKKWLLVRDTSYTDATTFNSAMSGAVLVYELAMPTYETLPDSIQAELNALTTYNPITNVFVSAGVTPYIDVSFWTRDYYAKISAENAAKVATNFIGYDSTNGLIIGNKTSGTWSGYRSQILPGSFNVLDASSTVLASFGPTTIIGEEAKANMHLTFNNFSMADKDGTTLFKVGDNRNAEGIATLQWSSPDVPIGTSGSTTITVGNTISSIVSVYVDSVELSSSNYSFSGDEVTINNLTANSEKYIEIIYNTTDPAYYLTFGYRRSSSIIGEYSVAEGRHLIASGFASHAEGAGTSAIGAYSHAEGHMSEARGAYSHAGGYHTVADGSYMTAFGSYNTENSGKAFVVGIGDFLNRRDGFTVDWNGNATMKGGLTLGTALSIANGGTGAKTAAGARANLGVVAAEDTGWVNLTTQKGTWDYCQYRYKNGVVYIRGYATAYAWSGTTPDIIVENGKIPEQYRPSSDVDCVVRCAGTRWGQIGVGVTGSIYVDRILNGTTAYTTSNWLRFNASYPI